MKYLFALALAVFTGIATQAPAQQFPAIYDVVDVASDDMLNIRSIPSNAGAIVGALDHNQQFVEVIRLSDTGRWGLVNAGDVAGWVFMRYMARQPDQPEMPTFMICSGTEPFWDIEIAQQAGVLHRPDHDPIDLAPRWRGLSVQAREMGFVLHNGAGQVSVAVRRARCSDGMSDREYGFAATALVDLGPGLQNVLSGCCTLEGY